MSDEVVDATPTWLSVLPIYLGWKETARRSGGTM